jgi:long-subunit acyl-CoA synthetase (AMP-forming)
VLARLRREIEQGVNRRAGHPYERIRAVAIIEAPSVERQTLTVTEKPKRKEIERRYAQVIDELYANHDEWIKPEPSLLTNTRRVAAL